MRRAIAADYDAVVDLSPSGPHMPDCAYGLVKRTYRIENGALSLTRAEPLMGDIRYGPHGERPDGLALGSDFWIYKRLTDVMIKGRAIAPGGRPLGEMEVRCDVGDRHKRVAVFGRRLIAWRNGKPTIGDSELFSEMPLDNAHAYGGIDTRVPYPPFRSVIEAALFALNHPGTYPRNAVGKGYYVVDEPFDGIEMPNLEHPDDLLTADRLVVGDATRWGPQPMPWSFDWQPHWTFPRCVFVGRPPRYDVPAEQLTEVRLGVLSPRYQLIGDDTSATDEQTRRIREIFRDRFYQEASTRMSLGPLAEGVPVQLSGMTESGSLTFALPPAPQLEITVDATAERVEARMSNVVIHPDTGRVMITWFGVNSGLPRKLVKGVHKSLPVSLRIDGSEVVAVEEPPSDPPRDP